jgi:hypothetical protein
MSNKQKHIKLLKDDSIVWKMWIKSFIPTVLITALKQRGINALEYAWEIDSVTKINLLDKKTYQTVFTIERI